MREVRNLFIFLLLLLGIFFILQQNFFIDETILSGLIYIPFFSLRDLNELDRTGKILRHRSKHLNCDCLLISFLLLLGNGKGGNEEVWCWIVMRWIFIFYVTRFVWIKRAWIAKELIKNKCTFPSNFILKYISDYVFINSLENYIINMEYFLKHFHIWTKKKVFSPTIKKQPRVCCAYYNKN